MELTKEKVIAVVLEDTVELLEPYMREMEPNISQQKIDELMNLVTIRPELMDYAKTTARDYYIDKFNVGVVFNGDGTFKRLY